MTRGVLLCPKPDLPIYIQNGSRDTNACQDVHFLDARDL
jgi:hypothetical protein